MLAHASVSPLAGGRPRRPARKDLRRAWDLADRRRSIEDLLQA